MIAYTILPGDTLTGLILRFQTTRYILETDNPAVNFNALVPSTTISIRSSAEYAQDITEKNNALLKEVSELNLTDALRTSVVENAAVVEPLGYIQFNEEGAVYQLNSDRTISAKASVEAGATYPYYGTTSNGQALYVLSGVNNVVPATNVRVIPISTATAQAVVSITNTTQKGKAATQQVNDFSIPQFEMPGYTRTRLRVKDTAGTELIIELRVTSFAPNPSNSFTPSRTNAGWLVAVGGKNLHTVSLAGFWLDTVGNPEAHQFMEFYNKHLTPRNSANYFSSEIVTLLHKDWVYKGLITSFSLSDDSSNPLQRGFQMQMLCLNDYSISRSAQNTYLKDVVKRDKADSAENELEFRSNLSKMMSNPLSGAYFVDPN